MHYWSEARSWAREHTKTYTLPKAIPPILAAIVQYLVFHQQTMRQVAVTTAIISGGYVLLYALEFVWKLLFLAPSAIYADQRLRINALKSDINELKSDPADAHHYRIALEAVGKLSDQAKHVLSSLWTNGAFLRRPQVAGREYTNFQIAGVEGNELSAILDQLVGLEILQRTDDRDHTGVFALWDIPPGFKKALGRLLYSQPDSGGTDG
jgi:hypothetical protein